MNEKNTKLLLVDDDPMIRALYEQAFRLMGYNIETAVDGQDGTDKLEKMPELPDLILLDMMMPRMSGFDVLRYIMHNDRLKDIPVVVLTSVGENEAAETAMKLGASAYLVKTDLEPRQVVEKIKSILAANGSDSAKE